MEIFLQYWAPKALTPFVDTVTGITGEAGWANDGTWIMLPMGSIAEALKEAERLPPSAGGIMVTCSIEHLRFGNAYTREDGWAHQSMVQR